MTALIRNRFLRYALPWAVALAIFYFLFRRYPPSSVLQAAEGVNVAFFLSFSAGYFLYMWFVDCWSLAAVFTKFGVPSKPKDFWALRMASYAVMVLNYSASQGLMAYALKKGKHTTLSKAASLFALVAALDFYWTVTFAFAASCFGPIPVRGVDIAPWLRLAWVAANLAFAFLLFALKSSLSHRLLPGPLYRALSHDLLNAFPKAPLRKYAFALLERLPIHAALNTALFFTALAFGVHIPVREVVAKFPVVSVVATVPITPGGLGTAQAAIVELFHDAASPEKLLSMSLLFAVTNAVIKAILGAVFFRRAVTPRQRILG